MRQLELRFLLCFLLVPAGVVPLASVPVSHNSKNEAAVLSRREAANTLLGQSIFLVAPLVVTPTQTAAAGDSNNDNSVQQLTVPNILKSLDAVPTFCIVNPESGAPYMLYQRDNSFAKGYAFTTYNGAQYVLVDAQKTAVQGGYGDVWKDATITVIPASIAVRLALQPKERMSQKAAMGPVKSAVEIVPDYQDREAAMKVDRQLFKDPSKVPLFFFDKLLTQDGSNTTPLYFNPDELVGEWVKRYGESAVPPRVQVIDLIALLQYVIRGRSSELPFPRGNGITFVASKDALEKARELKSKGLAPYKPDRMII